MVKNGMIEPVDKPTDRVNSMVVTEKKDGYVLIATSTLNENILLFRHFKKSSHSWGNTTTFQFSTNRQPFGKFIYMKTPET